MSWNNGYERRKFEQAQKAQAKEYRKCKEVHLQLFDPQESLQVGGFECERVDMK